MSTYHLFTSVHFVGPLAVALPSGGTFIDSDSCLEKVIFTFDVDW